MTGQFIIVRSDALQDPELLKSPTTFMTLCAISTMTSQNKGGWCYFKQETIAERLGKSRQAVSQSLNKLKKLGYLEIQHQSYKGRQSNNLYRLVYDAPLSTVQDELAPMPQGEIAPSAQGELAPKRPEYIKEQKEKKALTRCEFLRFVDGSYQDGAFSEWEYLTESEIKCEAEACLDFYGAKGEWPAGDPTYVLRHWIRGGVKKGKIRAKPKEEARQEVQAAEPENELQDWHKRIEPYFQPNVFKTYIRPLVWDGNGTIKAPSKFYADYVRTHFHSEITKATHNGVEIIHQPQTGVSPQ